MVNQNNNTIYALSSGQGKAGVAVIRISGAMVRNILFEITGKEEFEPRVFFTSEISDPIKKVLIDFGLVVYFAGPNSFTGENVAELHIHGGYSVIKATLEMLGQFPDTRLADPGEFTRRAFRNNKFDLTGAEAIADLLNAETEIQRLQALGQIGGNLSKYCFKWREDLVKALSFQEVLIDFSFEDIPDDTQVEVNDLVKSVYESICEHLKSRSGEKIRDGLSVVILGEPNVGKSSLMNKLTRTESAIVSSIAGTTRDIIEVRMDLSGILVSFFDTAGLRGNSIDPIEKIGIDRAKQKADCADIKVFIFSPDNLELNADLSDLIDDKTILVMNKYDLISNADNIFARFKEINSGLSNFIDLVCTSVVDDFGIDDLLEKISNKGKDMVNVESGSIITQERHRQVLLEVKQYLHDFLLSDGDLLPEIQAENLRVALFNLGKVTGEVDIEELFDVIFSSFCLGK